MGASAAHDKDRGSSYDRALPSVAWATAYAHGESRFLPANPDMGSVVNFTGSATGGTQPHNYTWSFGDGARSVGQTVVHVYLVVGNYTANLTVTDASRQIATTSQAISIDTDPSQPQHLQAIRTQLSLGP